MTNKEKKFAQKKLNQIWTLKILVSLVSEHNKLLNTTKKFQLLSKSANYTTLDDKQNAPYIMYYFFTKYIVFYNYTYVV